MVNNFMNEYNRAMANAYNKAMAAAGRLEEATKGRVVTPQVIKTQYNKAINEKCVIEYSEQSKLKVQYVNPQGKYIQVFLKRI